MNTNKTLNIQKFKNLNVYKKRFDEIQIQIKSNFLKNNNGFETCKHISDSTDDLVSAIFRVQINKKALKKSDLLICAIGGYGRRQLAPYSDLDILFVPAKQSKTPYKKIENSIKEILYALWDMGFKVGHIIKDIIDFKNISSDDHVTQTSILDYRKIYGDEALFKVVRNEIDSYFKSDTKNNFIKIKSLERQKRLINKRNNSYLLEPNIKECIGGLRDINILFWIFKTKKNTNELSKISKKKFISKSESYKIKKSLDFILTIRCYLHYLSKRPNERLTFELQKIISEKMNYKTRNSTLGVERLMKHYFLQIKNIKNLANFIVAASILSDKEPNYLKKDFITEGISIENSYIVIEKKKIFLNNYENFFKIFHDSYKYKVPLHPNTKRFIFDWSKKIKINLSPESRLNKLFIEILTDSNDKFTLEMLNDIGILSKIIPEFKNILSQSQFDRYHVYTVDQHTLRAIYFLKKIKTEKNIQKNLVFAKSLLNLISNKVPLFFAVLLHDIGKGLGGNHEKKGTRIAEKISKRMGLEDKDEIIWLVNNHSIYSEFAFNKDIEDISVIKKFVQKVNTIDRLKFLYLLTVVDIHAVNDDIWNDWKSILLQKLYKKCEKEIITPDTNSQLNKKINTIKKEVMQNLITHSEVSYKKFCSITYPSFWLLQTPKKIASQIDNFFKGSEKIKDIDFSISFQNSGLFDLTIVANDRRNFLLDVIAAVISSDMNVLEARIFTLENNTVVDTFKLSVKENLKLNINDLEKKKKILGEKLKTLNTKNFKKNLADKQRQNNLKIFDRKTTITIDNNSSKTYTIIKVSTNDRDFLLYDILMVLLEKEIVVSTAKISTFVDYIEDTFYVRNIFGFKIIKSEEIKIIKRSIRKQILSGN